ncbi:MAG TPA: response regulator transcription factor [Solirubrobacteraceae bacterium]|nr:response regulator transcription factor [Solirubrobacteraceae bacterium]
MLDAAKRAMRVLVVDDHNFFRAGLSTLLREHGLEIVGEAGTGEEALAMVEARAPEVVIMDLGLPQMSGLEATRLLRERHPEIAVLVLTASLDEHDVVDALLAGASGYLLKDATVDQILGGLEGALEGEAVISPRVNRLLVERVRQSPELQRDRDAPTPHLTEREHEILALLVEGRENLEIASQLYLSPSTVKNHISTILDKLGVQNRIQAAVYAVRSGLV